MRISLVFKLMGAFLLLIIVSALIISLSTSFGTRQAFNQYSSNNRRDWSQRLADDLADFYAVNNEWQGVDQFLTAELNSEMHIPGNMMGKGKYEREGRENTAIMGGIINDYGLRVMLADSSRTLVFDSHNDSVGEQISGDDYEAGFPVIFGNEQVGSLLVSSGSIIAGSAAAQFLESVNHSIVFSVIAGGLIAILMGALLFNQITSPLRQLKKAAVEVGNGNFKQRVSINSRDEFSDVGKSFNQMAESLEKSEEARQHYMADIAHELRTPLTAIQGTVEAMQDKILPHDEEQLDILHNQTALLNRLVNDLRLLSLAETGHLKLDKSLVNPGDLTRQIVEGLKPLAAPKNISLETVIQDDIPEWKLDPDRFAQVLNNLLGNAIRYTPENGRISVHVDHQSSINEIQIRVTDSGTGIAPEDLAYVFDRFYRADKSRARLSGGAGLGLAIVKRLVEAHSGSISVKSPVSKDDNGMGFGTEFLIHFPLAS